MPESISDIYQEKGRAGRYLNSNAMDNKYVLCFSLEDLFYLYKEAMDSEETVLNEKFRERIVSDMLDMVKVLASDRCMNVSIDKKLGNAEFGHLVPPSCHHCPVCKKVKLFPTIKNMDEKPCSLICVCPVNILSRVRLQ